METVPAVLRATRTRDGIAFDPRDRAIPQQYQDFVTTVWKAGNLLSQFGLPGAGSVAVALGSADAGIGDCFLGESPAPLHALLGGLAVGAPVNPSPSTPVDAAVLIAPATCLEDYHPEPGCAVLAYGSAALPTGVGHFERQCWSENPTEPPESVQKDDVAIETPTGRRTHEELISAADRVRSTVGLSRDDVVALATPVNSPGAVAAGVLAPLMAGATIRPTQPGEGHEGALVVGSHSPDGIDPAAVW